MKHPRPIRLLGAVFAAALTLGRVDSRSVAAGTRVAPGSTVDITHGVAPAPPAECP